MLPVVQNQGRLRGGWQSFIKRRARRILIPFYPALFISSLVVLASNPAPPHDLIYPILANCLLLQNVLPNLHSINVAFWSVATEWQIYFLLPFVFVPLWMCSANRRAVILIVGFLIGVVCFVVNSYYLAVACFWYAGLFAQGMVAADIAYQMIVNGRVPLRFSSKLSGLAVAAITLYIATWKLVDAGNSNAGVGPQHWHQFYLSVALRDTFLGTLSCCTILYLIARVVSARTPKDKGLAVGILESRPLKTLGSFSYSLYLTHGIVLMCLDHAIDMHSLPPAAQLVVEIFGVIASVCFAYGFYLVFERPVVTQRVTTRQFA